MKRTAFILISFMLMCLVLAVYPENVTSKASAESGYYSVGSDSQSTLQSFSMPVEYINYTISMVNGSFWATVDGFFPMHIPLAWVGQELPMLYPTPQGTTNISVELDGQKVDYSNYSQTHPGMLHYTYLGEWPMIYCSIQPTSPDFLMTIHYQHPIMPVNGTNMFLYDLNISPYLSYSSNNSVAIFNVVFQAKCSDIMVYVVPGDCSIIRDDTRTPVNFTLSRFNGMQIAAFNITSNYTKPIPGDQLITFKNLQSQIPEYPTWAMLISLIIIAEGTFLLVYRKEKNSKV